MAELNLQTEAKQSLGKQDIIKHGHWNELEKL